MCFNKLKLKAQLSLTQLRLIPEAAQADKGQQQSGKTQTNFGLRDFHDWPSDKNVFGYLISITGLYRGG